MQYGIMVVIEHCTRRIIGFAVHVGDVDGPTVCRMFSYANSGQGWPKRVSPDNDPLFQYHRWKANPPVLEIEEITSLPHMPMSHPFVERLIGSIRGSHWIRLYSGLRLTWRTGLANISVITTSIEAMLDGMARRQLIQAAKISLRSTAIGGRSIVGGLFQLPVAA
jgi:hypothetical protein